ncbi:MAG TPA: hypothetical protein VMD02_01420 [Candidatus Omnitrophota bacterium]|nr:hypothetical protein [Candidatus Omnitrophota bacterium]
MISHTAAVAEHLQGKFLPQNYGYANAIHDGLIKLENDRLTVKTPSLSIDQPLPFYTCDSASHFAARELMSLGIGSAVVELNIPLLPPGENGTLGHKVCLAVENERDYVVGLATPIDRFLGINPSASLNEAPWLDRYFSVATNPFKHGFESRIFEHPFWRLRGIDTMVRPLAAENLPDGRLALAELGIGSAHDYLYMALVARILRFDPASYGAEVQWNDNVYLKLPLTELEMIKNYVAQIADNPAAARELLYKLDAVSYEHIIFNTSLDQQGRNLISRGWSSVVEFLSKLPALDIQKALGGR